MAAIAVVNALMGLPPVVVGLAVYLMLSGAGPLGVLQLLYTPTAMIIAQTILVTPTLSALTRQVVEDLHGEYDQLLLDMGARRPGVVPTPLGAPRYSPFTPALTRLPTATGGGCARQCSSWVT